MPYVKIMIHVVWSTKDREPFLESSELRKKVWKHIKDNAVGKGIFIDMINGYQEHCHCLISLGIDQTISKVMQLLKGESSIGSIRMVCAEKNLNGKMNILLPRCQNLWFPELETTSKIKRIIIKPRLLLRSMIS